LKHTGFKFVFAMVFGLKRGSREGGSSFFSRGGRSTSYMSTGEGGASRNDSQIVSSTFENTAKENSAEKIPEEEEKTNQK